MTCPAQASPSDQGAPPFSIPALVIWLTVQLLALGLAAARVPLWARSPAPGDELATDFMLVTQVVVAGLLFPVLLVNIRTTATMILTAAVFIELAGLLAGIPRGRMALAWGALSIWMITLWLIVPLVRRGRWATMLAIAFATCLTLGGPLLLYLRAESGSTVSMDWASIALCGPTLAIMAVIHAPTSTHHAWIGLGVLSGVGALVRVSSMLPRSSLHR